jgi:hypothetical protein
VRLRLARPLIALLFVAVVCGGLAGRAVAASSSLQRGYLVLALRGVHRAADGWGDASGWYRQLRNAGKHPPPASLWGSVHLFEALAAVEIVSPTAGHLAAVRQFARDAERFWNPDLPPRGGFGPLPGQRGAHRLAWFDDNGWWGLAFLDAYRATHDRRWLWDARRAYSYMALAGWDPVEGGFWWNTRHTFKAGESLATGTLLAAQLYGYTGERYYLDGALQFEAWGRTHTWNDQDQLFARHETDKTSMPYVQGPMAAADVLLCHLLRDNSLCARGEMLANAAARRFPRLQMGPQYDSMYLRWMLYLYALDRKPRWYYLAATQARRARFAAGDGHGFWSRAWDGTSMWLHGADPRMLQPHAATTMVFAWLAATPPPGP